MSDFSDYLYRSDSGDESSEGAPAFSGPPDLEGTDGWDPVIRRHPNRVQIPICELLDTDVMETPEPNPEFPNPSHHYEILLQNDPQNTKS